MNLGLRGQERLRLSIIYALCAIVLIWALAPIYWVAVSSISTRRELYAQPLQNLVPQRTDPWNLIAPYSHEGAKFRDGGFSPTADLMSSGIAQ